MSKCSTATVSQKIPSSRLKHRTFPGLLTAPFLSSLPPQQIRRRCQMIGLCFMSGADSIHRHRLHHPTLPLHSHFIGGHRINAGCSASQSHFRDTVAVLLLIAVVLCLKWVKISREVAIWISFGFEDWQHEHADLPYFQRTLHLTRGRSRQLCTSFKI